MLFWESFLLTFSDVCSAFQEFCEGFQRFCTDFNGFCPDFKGFCPNFHQIKTFGDALCAPCTPASYTSGAA